MGLFTKSKQVLRRLSVFYLFLGIMVMFLVLFFLKIVPANTAELNQRAQRALNQLATNFMDKDRDVQSLFRRPSSNTGQAVWDSSIIHYGINFAHLDNLPYTAKRIFTTSFANSNIDSSFLGKAGGNWNWIYNGNGADTGAAQGFLQISIPLADFAKPIFESRSDIFSTYLLLLDSPATGARRNLPLIYKQDPITVSDLLAGDTLNNLQKNSDGSAQADIIISGEAYKIFYHPFFLHGQKLLLAGLLGLDDYAQRTRQTPVEYIPASIIAILLLLIALPFIKIFMISSKETVTYKDMALTAISFYLGPVCGCLIIFYCVLHLVNGLTFSYRLQVLGNTLQKSVEKNISDARNRLIAYDNIPLTPGEINCLENPVDDTPDMSLLDSTMATHIDQHTIRVFWIDSAGQTIAKWNPMDFVAPNTPVSNYSFFRRFKDQKPAAADAKSPFYIVYAGKSNATGEFLIFITRPSAKKLVSQQPGTEGQKTVTSFAIVEAMSMDISNHPVLPPGFSFSLIDRDGVVLVDADPTRNLSENIFDESNQNGALKAVANGKDPGTAINVSRYGQSFLALAKPIHGQPLTLVILYDQKFLSENIIRLLLFSIQTVVWLTLAICACLLVSTIKKFTPNHLHFRIQSIEWIRPIVSNITSYAFTFRYFTSLILLFSSICFLLIAGNQDLRPLYIISLLLPFYGIWGFVISRNKSGKETNSTTAQQKQPPPELQPDDGAQAVKQPAPAAPSARQTYDTMFVRGIYPFCFIVGINVVIFFFLFETGWSTGLRCWLPFFELSAFAILFYLTRYHPRYPLTEKWNWVRKLKDNKRYAQYKKYEKSYGGSLILSMVLISILPVTGILSYAYQAEKLQYKKEKLLGYSCSLQQLQGFLRNDYTPGYKEVVSNQLGARALQHDLYLTDKDLLETVGPGKESRPVAKAVLPDRLYAWLVNGMALAGGADKAFLATGDKATDSAWNFGLDKKHIFSVPGLQLAYRPSAEGTNIPPIRSSTRLQNIITDFFQLPVAFWSLCVLIIILFGVGATSLVRFTIQRLFLRNFTTINNIRIDESFVSAKLQASPATASIIDGVPILPLPPNNPEMDGTVKTPSVETVFAPEFDPDLVWDKLNIQLEDYILASSIAFKDAYEFIWQNLSEPEKYVLFDFCIDYYTNYRNVEVFIKLIQKGILVNRNRLDSWEIFSLSFRQYILGKKNTTEIENLLGQFRTAGTWDAFKIAALSVIAVAGVVIVSTQSDLSHKVLALLTSLTALLPLVLRMFQFDTGKPAGAAK